MTKSTLKKINQFIEEFRGKHFKKITKKDWDRIMKQNVWVLGIRADNELVGMVFLYSIESLTRKALIFEEFIIDKKWRNKGLGVELMKAVIKFARKKKVDCIEAHTKQNNKIAQKLYKKLGFKDRRNIAYRLWLK